MAKLKRILKTVGKILLALVLLAIVAHVTLLAYWGKNVERQLAAIKASGAPLTPADLAGPPIPDAKNAAVIYDKAFELMSGKAFENDIELVCKVLYKPESGEINHETWDSARAAIGRNKELLALLDEALARPECRFPLPFDFSMSKVKIKTAQQVNHFVKRRFMRVAGDRQAVRLLCAKAIIAAHDGNGALSSASIKKAIELDNVVGERVTTIGIITKMAILKISLTSIRRTISYGGFSENQLIQISDALSQIDLDSDYRGTIEGERVVYLQQTAQSRSVYNLMAFHYWETSAYLDFVRKQLDSLDLSYAEACARKIADENDIPRYAILTRIIAPAIQSISFDRYNTQADIALGQTALALEAYKVRFGSYPRIINEIKSRMSMELPIDPFSEKNLVYKPEGQAYLLYSVGPDQKDDHGAEFKPSEKGVDKGDIVWGTN